MVHCGGILFCSKITSILCYFSNALWTNANHRYIVVLSFCSDQDMLNSWNWIAACINQLIFAFLVPKCSGIYSIIKNTAFGPPSIVCNFKMKHKLKIILYHLLSWFRAERMASRENICGLLWLTCNSKVVNTVRDCIFSWLYFLPLLLTLESWNWITSIATEIHRSVVSNLNVCILL